MTAHSGLPSDWIEHRRGDGELVGWIVPRGDVFGAFDVLGRAVGPGGLEWLEAEAALEERGIGFLAERFVLRLADGRERPVRIAEVSTRGIVVVADEFGAASAVGASPESYSLSFPAPPALRAV